MAVGTLVMTALGTSPRVAWLISTLDTQLAHCDHRHPGDSPHFSPVMDPRVSHLNSSFFWSCSCFGGAHPVAS